MAKKKSSTKELSFDDIKTAIVLGLFSNDHLLERLVLKGGNALSLIYAISTRASLDIDLSMPDKFEDLGVVSDQIEKGLKESFAKHLLTVFDFLMNEEPRVLSEDCAEFWGGYKIFFKLIENAKYLEHSDDLEWLRRNCLTVGESDSRKFEIDISKHEYTEEKCNRHIKGYKIYVYSPAMIVCEKLRAICQQTEPYLKKLKKYKARRARDFLDIYQICQAENIFPTDEKFRSTLQKVFAVKQVPLHLLELIEQERDHHEPDFVSVKDTVANASELKDFGFYFQYTLDFVRQLEAFWDM